MHTTRFLANLVPFTILSYTVTDKFTFHPGRIPYSKAYTEDRFRHYERRGRYQANYLTGPGTRKGDSRKTWGGFDPARARRHWAIPRSLRKFLPENGAGMSSDSLTCLALFDIVPHKRPPSDVLRRGVVISAVGLEDRKTWRNGQRLILPSAVAALADTQPEGRAAAPGQARAWQRRSTHKRIPLSVESLRFQGPG